MLTELKKRIKSKLYYFLLSVLFDKNGNFVDELVRRYQDRELFYNVANFIIWNQIGGDYLEFGSYRGDSLATVYRMLYYQWRNFEGDCKHYGYPYNLDFWLQKRFFAFDSFEGLPDTESVDKPIQYQSGVYRASVDSLIASLSAQSVDISKVVIIPGWFDKVLTDKLKKDHNLSKACMIFIDCDLYESSVPVFKFISDLIQDGTVIVMDDYFRYSGNPQKGIQRAFREWLAKCPEVKVTELTRCKANRIAFVCHKNKE